MYKCTIVFYYNATVHFLICCQQWLKQSADECYNIFMDEYNLQIKSWHEMLEILKIGSYSSCNYQSKFTIDSLIGTNGNPITIFLQLNQTPEDKCIPSLSPVW